jgi:hypothetical protein
MNTHGSSSVSADHDIIIQEVLMTFLSTQKLFDFGRMVLLREVELDAARTEPPNGKNNCNLGDPGFRVKV